MFGRADVEARHGLVVRAHPVRRLLVPGSRARRRFQYAADVAHRPASDRTVVHAFVELDAFVDDRRRRRHVLLARGGHGPAAVP